MSLLTIVQHACRRANIPVPSSVYGTSDEQVAQILSILEEEGNDLSGRHTWQSMTFEATHTTVAAESQGAIATIASNGFRYILNNTIYDRTEKAQISIIDGPDWQATKAVTTAGTRYYARIRGGNLIATPTPTAGNTWAFEYASWNWITSSDGSTYRQYFADDADITLLPESILLSGLRWRWKKEKGLEYAEDFRSYETQLAQAAARDGMKHNLNLGATPGNRYPGVLVPDGSWMT